MPRVLTFDAPPTEMDRLRNLAAQIRNVAHLDQILSEIPDPALRDAVRTFLTAHVPFEIPIHDHQPTD